MIFPMVMHSLKISKIRGVFRFGRRPAGLGRLSGKCNAPEDFKMKFVFQILLHNSIRLYLASIPCAVVLYDDGYTNFEHANDYTNICFPPCGMFIFSLISTWILHQKSFFQELLFRIYLPLPCFYLHESNSLHHRYSRRNMPYLQ